MTHIPLVRDTVHGNANETTDTMSSHSRGPRQPRRRMPMSHERNSNSASTTGPRKHEKKRERKRRVVPGLPITPIGYKEMIEKRITDEETTRKLLELTLTAFDGFYDML
ncbi:hypothetical protein G5I_04061 [Acromyrmex echinatior]|uniref:Uncharacterized protein n=1 Tax=Acromyrmex echinatior TaxID=103372 RepID=F4WED0_ACREC|nr:hypothetical protein G5I_04061 [Acromyrmex echinatior]